MPHHIHGTDTRSASLPEPRRLEPQQLHALACLAHGMTLSACARELDISERTLRRRLRTVCDQLDVAAPIQAVVWAAKQGYI